MPAVPLDQTSGSFSHTGAADTALQPPLHNQIYPAIDPAKFKGVHKGKVVIVTGAQRGIGQAIATQFAYSGATLALADISKEGLKETIEACEKVGAKAMGFKCDVTKHDDCAKVVDEVENTLGPIDVLVNNAGTATQYPFHLMSAESFSREMAVNLTGPMNFMSLLIPRFRSRKRGCVINMASRSGTISSPFCSSYNTSKAALIRLTRCIQMEVDYDGLTDIHLYALHPGAVVSAMSQSGVPQVMRDHYPDFAAMLPTWKAKFKTDRNVAGCTAVALAAGIAKDVLRGRFFDVEQDLGFVTAHGKEITDRELYELKVDFLGGLPNDGGMENRDGEPVYKSLHV